MKRLIFHSAFCILHSALPFLLLSSSGYAQEAATLKAMRYDARSQLTQIVLVFDRKVDEEQTTRAMLIELKFPNTTLSDFVRPRISPSDRLLKDFTLNQAKGDYTTSLILILHRRATLRLSWLSSPYRLAIDLKPAIGAGDAVAEKSSSGGSRKDSGSSSRKGSSSSGGSSRESEKVIVERGKLPITAATLARRESGKVRTPNSELRTVLPLTKGEPEGVEFLLSIEDRLGEPTSPNPSLVRRGTPPNSFDKLSQLPGQSPPSPGETTGDQPDSTAQTLSRAEPREAHSETVPLTGLAGQLYEQQTATGKIPVDELDNAIIVQTEQPQPIIRAQPAEPVWKRILSWPKISWAYLQILLDVVLIGGLTLLWLRLRQIRHSLSKLAVGKQNEKNFEEILTQTVKGTQAPPRKEAFQSRSSERETRSKNLFHTPSSEFRAPNVPAAEMESEPLPLNTTHSPQNPQSKRPSRSSDSFVEDMRQALARISAEIETLMEHSPDQSPQASMLEEETILEEDKSLKAVVRRMSNKGITVAQIATQLGLPREEISLLLSIDSGRSREESGGG